MKQWSSFRGQIYSNGTNVLTSNDVTSNDVTSNVDTSIGNILIEINVLIDKRRKNYKTTNLS
jgi:hypothetical protein